MTTVPAPLLALVTELTGDLGPGQAGVLLAGHPEALPSPPLPATWPSEASVPPTRVLATPAPLDGKLARGSRVSVEGQPFVVQRVAVREAAVLDHHGEVEQVVEVTTADICDEHGAISCGPRPATIVHQIGL